MSNIKNAIDIAFTLHAGQMDKQGEDYILHPLRVWARLIEQDEAVQIAAILHDVVEDTEYSLIDARRDFGPEVASLVDDLSRREGESYTDFIRRIAKSDHRSVQIKLADLADNMDPRRQYEGMEGLMKRYEHAKNILIDVLVMKTEGPEESDIAQ